jgi:myosin heavy subunit
MNIIGLQKSEQDEIFKLLATILWIGNLVFVEDDAGNAAISDGDGKQSNKKRGKFRYSKIVSFF